MKARIVRFVVLSPSCRGRVRRSARGQATIEFALVLPVMLLIALGAMDVGRVFFDYIGLRNAAIEGAIYGSRNLNATPDEIKQRVREHFLPNPPPAGLDVPTAVQDGSCASVDGVGFVTVTATRPFSPLSLAALEYVAPGTDWTFTVSSTAKTRCMT